MTLRHENKTEVTYKTEVYFAWYSHAYSNVDLNSFVL